MTKAQGSFRIEVSGRQGIRTRHVGARQKVHFAAIPTADSERHWAMGMK
jgi:hypothetical protein